MRKVYCACDTVLLQCTGSPRSSLPSTSEDTALSCVKIFRHPCKPLPHSVSVLFGGSLSRWYGPRIVLHAHGLSISLARIHRLASLLDRGQHGIVRDSGFGGNVCRLGFEADIECFDACNP